MNNIQQNRGNIRHSTDIESSAEGVHTFQKAALYILGNYFILFDSRLKSRILGEKAQMKGAKIECTSMTDFIPVEYYDVRHTKAAFKKLMRACVPSSHTVEPEQSFYR